MYSMNPKPQMKQEMIHERGDVYLVYLGVPSLPYAQEKNLHLYPLRGAEVHQGTQGTPLIGGTVS